MLFSSIPTKLPIPWAKNAGGSFIRAIPTASQIGIQNGAASLNDGFVPENFLPTASGGVPPFGQDMNGILNWATEILQWAQAGGPWPYDGTFSSEVGGYPKQAVVGSNVVPGRLWMSTVDSNTTDPDSTSAANWVTPPGQMPVGMPIPALAATTLPGAVQATGSTIGNASSNATARENSDTLLLFRFVWTNFSNSQCPLLNSSGSPVSRGANPDADFNANCQLTLPNLKGASLIGVDLGSGPALLTGVPVVIGNTTTQGSILGETLHSLTSGENGPHTHTITDPTHTHGITTLLGSTVLTTAGGGESYGSGGNSHIGISSGFSINNASTGINGTNSSGSGTGHNTVQRSMAVFWNLAL